jgi:DNA polymerase-3 subunit beta
MEIIVSRNSLLKELNKLLPLVPTRPSVPELTSFLFKPGGENTLVVTACDGDIFLSTVVELVDGGVVDNGFLVDARTLVSTLKLIPEQPVRLAVEERENYNLITLYFDGGKYELSSPDKAAEWPEKRLPASNTSDVALLPAAAVLPALRCAAVCAHTDELLYTNMSCTYFKFTHEGFDIVSTDAYRVALFHLPISPLGDKDRSFLLPRKASAVLRNMLEEGADDAVEVMFDADIAVFNGRFNMTCKLFDGQYPNYRAVIPTDNPTSVIIDRAALLAAMRRSDAFVTTPLNTCRFYFTENGVRLLQKNEEFVRTAEEFLPILAKETKDDTAPTVLGFSIKYLISLISHIPTERIVLSFSTHKRPVLLLPDTEDSRPQGADITMLVMPIMVEENAEK